MPPPPILALNLTEDQAREIWSEYFSKHQANPRQVATAILKLHNKRQHEHVIAAIEAALVHGQSQPWMYDVLALSMQIVKKPKEDIERVLLSRIDFTATNVPNMLYSAAHLTRFGADTQALHLYRQASQLAPLRPEPYLLALKLARREKDYDAVGWAASGILTTVWSKDFQQQHRVAENAVFESLQELKNANRAEEAIALKETLAEAQKRDLMIKLTWSGNGDLDLLVEEPPGSVCSHQSRRTLAGGVFVHDGYGPDQKNCYEEYVCAVGVPGKYRIRVRHAWGDIVGKRAQLTIIRYDGSDKRHIRTFNVAVTSEDQIVRLSLPRGRRTELLPAQAAQKTLDAPQRPHDRRGTLGRLDARSRAAARKFDAAQERASMRRQAGAFTGIGYQPIITLIPEGTSMEATAIVSADRRYVRITATPIFSAVNRVLTFSFLTIGGGGGGGVGGGGGGN